jgi:hypothetical protein
MSSPRRRARGAILEAIQTDTRDVLSSLYSDVLPHWRVARPDLYIQIDVPVIDLYADINGIILTNEDPRPKFEELLKSVILREHILDPIEFAIRRNRSADHVTSRLMQVPQARSDGLGDRLEQAARLARQYREDERLRIREPEYWASIPEKLSGVASSLTSYIFDDDQLHTFLHDPEANPLLDWDTMNSARIRGSRALRTLGRPALEHVIPNRRAIEATYPDLIAHTDTVPERLVPHLEALCRFVSWARRWQLSDDWLVLQSLVTLDTWAQEEPPHPPHWPGLYLDGSVGDPILSDIYAYSWFLAWGGPAVEPWASFKRRALTDFKSWLNRHKEKVEGTSSQVIPAYEPSKLEQHAMWLVLYQFGPEGVRGNYSAVASEVLRRDPEGKNAPDVSSVTKNVPRLAGLAGMTLRVPKIGRHG